MTRREYLQVELDAANMMWREAERRLAPESGPYGRRPDPDAPREVLVTLRTFSAARVRALMQLLEEERS